jgi:hypothetical protein
MVSCRNECLCLKTVKLGQVYRMIVTSGWFLLKLKWAILMCLLCSRPTFWFRIFMLAQWYNSPQEVVTISVQWCAH